MLGTWLTNGSSNIDSSVYTYNVGNQRTTVTRTGENTVAYTYDSTGQVIADQATELSGGAARMNEQLHYVFDPAGNLLYRTNNTLIANFAVNSVNQLTANTNGGKLTVMGTTTSAATNVTVNGSNALCGCAGVSPHYLHFFPSLKRVIKVNMRSSGRCQAGVRP